MHPLLLTLFIGALLLRVGSVAVSMRHEKALKAHGAREYGRSNSHLLAAAHVLFYGGALVEGLWRSTQLTRWTTVGIVLYVLSIIALLLVWRELKGLWTVKLLIASDHPLNQSALFRWVRHHPVTRIPIWVIHPPNGRTMALSKTDAQSFDTQAVPASVHPCAGFFASPASLAVSRDVLLIRPARSAFMWDVHRPPHSRLHAVMT